MKAVFLDADTLGNDVDLSPIVAREVALSDTSAELVAFNGPTPPGVAVITDLLG